MGFLSNLIKGKKQTIDADPIASKLKALGMRGADMQSRAFDRLENLDPNTAISSQLAEEQRSIRGAGRDAERNAQRMAAQRGLGSSSIGLAMQNDAFRQTADRLAQSQGSRGSRLYDLTNRQAENAFNLGSNAIAQRGPIRMNKQKFRSGGLGSVLGTVAGAAFGGPAGAKIGGALGGALQNS